MSYFKDLYVNPFFKTNKEWKTIIVTTGIDIVVISILFALLLLSITAIERSGQTLKDNNLENKIELFENAEIYASELESFLSNFYLIIIGVTILFFIIYSLTRTFIWNKILKIKFNFINYIRNIFIDSLIVGVLIGLFLIIISYMQMNAQEIIIPILLVVMLYYSLFVHLNLRKDIKKIFKVKLKNLLLLLPHFLLFSFIIYTLLNTLIGLVFAIFVFNYFRVFSSIIVY